MAWQKIASKGDISGGGKEFTHTVFNQMDINLMPYAYGSIAPG